ncbi:MAG: ATP-binding cassette domain-containing protein [Saprospiraceae bacterium]|nr:ATP-binding cassette domain-containing protein [Saprospiraceae bacterium]
MIRAEGIYKSFSDLEVLKGIDFTFEAGKTNLIIGKSGAGKTVLLKILVGLLEATEGHVWYDDRDLCKMSKNALLDLRMEVGMLFQGNALFDSMTVEENIMFPMDMFTNRTYKEKLDQVNFCLERVSMEGINNKYPSEISGGMQKRVGIARAIVLNPRYLFADEPNSGLDPKTAIKIDELLLDITKDKNITTIINTHDMNSVMEIGENICLLHEGRLAWQGHKDEVLESTNETLHDFIFASPFLQRLKDRALSNTPNS